MQRITPLKTDDQEFNSEGLVDQWKRYLQEQDHSPGTVEKYTQAVTHFCLWYEQEERMPLRLSHLTPIALIGRVSGQS
jgi:hypothetical protein